MGKAKGRELSAVAAAGEKGSVCSTRRGECGAVVDVRKEWSEMGSEQQAGARACWSLSQGQREALRGFLQGA